MAERSTADAEQAGDTSGQMPLPLWVTIGDEELANADEGALIGEYDSDRALQDAVDKHPLNEYILAAIEEVRRDAAFSPEGAYKHRDTSGEAALPLWVTIGDEDLADGGADEPEGALIGEYQSDDALRGAVKGHPLEDQILAAIQEVRGGADPSTDTTSPLEAGADDAA